MNEVTLPSYLGYFQPLAVKSSYSPFDDAQTDFIGAFIASLKQRLHAQAYPEEGSISGYVRLESFDPTSGFQALFVA